VNIGWWFYLSEAPKVGVKEIAIVLKDSPTAFCRNTAYKGVKMCFDKNLDVTKWLYDPKTFARTYNADIDKLQAKVDDCPVCQKTAKILELRRKDGEQQKIITDSLVTFAYTMLEDLSRQEGVPVPEVKIGTCPSPEARTKTCYLVKEDQLGIVAEKDPGRIWIHPEDIGPTAIAHEFYHYMKYQKGDEHEARDEMKANEYARGKVHEMFPESSEDFNSESTIFNLSGVNNMLADLYEPLAKHMQGIDKNDVDEAITPELIATAVETALVAVMDKFGAVIANVALGGVYLGSCMINRVPIKWKKTLLEMSGHHLSRAIHMFSPREFSVVTSQAFDFGRSLRAFDGGAIAGHFFKGFDILGEDMRIASQTIDGIMKAASPNAPIQEQVKQKYSGISPIPGLDLGISRS
jgi:hypothetical protein